MSGVNLVPLSPGTSANTYVTMPNDREFNILIQVGSAGNIVYYTKTVVAQGLGTAPRSYIVDSRNPQMTTPTDTGSLIIDLSVNQARTLLTATLRDLARTTEAVLFVYALRQTAEPTVQGEKGEKGDPGRDGRDGRDGSDATVTTQNILRAVGGTPQDNQVLTYDESGTTLDWSDPPRGEQGERGLRGLPGRDSTVPGPAGPAGRDGVDGRDSTVPGPAGPAGRDGKDSTVPGPAGRDGRDGSDASVTNANIVLAIDGVPLDDQIIQYDFLTGRLQFADPPAGAPASGGTGTQAPAQASASSEEERYRALKEAYESGATNINYAGKSITYRNPDELLKVLRQMERRLGFSKARPRRAVMIRRGREFY